MIGEKYFYIPQSFKFSGPSNVRKHAFWGNKTKGTLLSETFSPGFDSVIRKLKKPGLSIVIVSIPLSLSHAPEGF